MGGTRELTFEEQKQVAAAFKNSWRGKQFTSDNDKDIRESIESLGLLKSVIEPVDKTWRSGDKYVMINTTSTDFQVQYGSPYGIKSFPLTSTGRGEAINFANQKRKEYENNFGK